MLSKAFSPDRNALGFCLGLLVAACLSASLVFACAAPFAAFAVIAAALLPMRQALVTIGVVWLANQALGFGVLGYPWTANAAVWGLVIGVAALVATMIAVVAFSRLAHLGRFAIYPIALVASFAAYELIILAAVPALGGGDAMAPAIIGQVAFTNAIWLAGLVAICEVARRLDVAAQRHAVR
jgi:hypothetical protein